MLGVVPGDLFNLQSPSGQVSHQPGFLQMFVTFPSPTQTTKVIWKDELPIFHPCRRQPSGAIVSFLFCHLNLSPFSDLSWTFPSIRQDDQRLAASKQAWGPSRRPSQHTWPCLDQTLTNLSFTAHLSQEPNGLSGVQYSVWHIMGA